MRIHDLVALTGWQPLDTPWLRARTIKLYHGLSLSGRTARLYEAYANRPDYFGLEPQRSQAELDELVEEIHDAGFQAAIHSNGDYEIDMVLEAIERAVGRFPRRSPPPDRAWIHRQREDPVANARPGNRARAPFLRLRERNHARGLRRAALGLDVRQRIDLRIRNSERCQLGFPCQRPEPAASHPEPGHPEEPTRQGVRPPPED